ncbi:MAG: hypothetical protein MH252_09715 [Thermosynechococcaceae cyanobacterium MS004]|nr:hypothetical protein [Thermosynechococcaceae cyanobacterium MS004]
MDLFKSTLVIAALSLSTLTGCGEETKTVTDGGKDAPAQTAGQNSVANTLEKGKAMAKNVMAIKDGVPTIITGVAATTTAVKAGDFAKAKDEITKVQGAWGKMREEVEKKSPESYKAINEGLGKAQTELSEAKPESGKVLTSLESLAAPLKALSGV